MTCAVGSGRITAEKDHDRYNKWPLERVLVGGPHLCQVIRGGSSMRKGGPTFLLHVWDKLHREFPCGRASPPESSPKPCSVPIAELSAGKRTLGPISIIRGKYAS